MYWICYDFLWRWCGVFIATVTHPFLAHGHFLDKRSGVLDGWPFVCLGRDALLHDLGRRRGQLSDAFAQTLRDMLVDVTLDAVPS